MSRGRVIGAWFKRAWFLLVASAVLIAAIAWVYGTTADPGLSHSSALNVVFDSRLMIAGARVLMGAGVAYLLLSIIVRVKRGHWVRAAGPFQTDEGSGKKFAGSQATLLGQLQEAEETIEDLKERLAHSLAARRDLLVTLNQSRKRGWRRTRRGPRP